MCLPYFSILSQHLRRSICPILEDAGVDPEIPCPAAIDGTGPLGRVAPQTGGVSAEELYYTSYHMLFIP